MVGHGRLLCTCLLIAASLALAPVAAGDTVVVNDVVTGGDVSKYVGQTGSAQVHLIAISGSSDINGCNVDSTHPAMITLQSSAPSKVAIASPGTVSLNACDLSTTTTIQEGNRTLGYSVVGGNVGDVVTIYANFTSGGLGPTSSPARSPTYVNDTFRVTIAAAPPPADTSAPEIAYALSPASPDGANGWYRSAVSIDWSVWDNQSSLSSTTGCADESISADTSGLTRTCSATSAGGTSNATTPTIKLDRTAPSVSLVGGPVDGQSSAAGAVPAAPSCSASDATSGVGSPPCSVEGYATTIGTHTVYANATDNAGNANSTSASYTVTDGTGPEIAYALSPAAPDGANGWYRSPVAIDWSVWDNESAISGSTGCADETVSTDTSGLARTCEATSAGGTANATTPTIKLDGTKPSVALVGGPADGQSYAYGTVPAAPTCSASDATSGLGSPECSVEGYGASLGAHTVYANATDNAGNANSTFASYSVYDATPPEIVYALSPASPDGANGWYRSDVTIDWSVWDNESAITGSTGCADETLSTQTTGVARTCEAVSAGGTSNLTTVTLKLDKTKPSVTLVGGPAAGASYAWGSVPAAPTCDATDAVSGLGSPACSVSGYATTAGTHTVYANATDLAGNTNSTSISYTVTGWTTLGFYAPANDALNSVRGGSTVPLKFELFAGANEVTATTGLQFKAVRVSCTSGAEDAIEELASTGGTSLRYDAVAGQFVQNWQTPRIPGACYDAVLSGAGIDPGAPLVARFRLR